MKLKVNESDGAVVIGEVYSGAYIETAEGNRLGFCLRDDTVEINVLPKGGGNRWHRVNMQTLEVEHMDSSPSPFSSLGNANDSSGPPR